MIADTTLDQATSRTDRPRAFEPSQAAALPTPAREPGWDLGPERRIDDGHALARMLVYAGIGLTVLVAAAGVMTSRGDRS